MKSLVIYVSKRGTTKECAIKIANAIKGEAVDIKQIKKINLGDYGQVIIGSYIYAGMVPTKMKKFCINHVNLLKNRKLSFYVIGVGKADDMIETFKKQVPKELINKKTMISHFGGELRMEKANFFERMIIKKITQEQKINPKINEEEITKFISKLKVK